MYVDLVQANVKVGTRASHVTYPAVHYNYNGIDTVEDRKRPGCGSCWQVAGGVLVALRALVIKL